MILSDRDIKAEVAAGRLCISPFDSNLVQPSSVDVRLDRKFLVFKRGALGVIDPRLPVDEFMELVEVTQGGSYAVPPREFILGTTLEKVTLPDDIVGRLEGRSSLGRLGIVIHSTAGYIDPGFSGQLTLEISNLSPVPVKLYPGMRIAQVSFIRLSSPAERTYQDKALGSKYQDQEGPTASRIYKDFG